MYVTDTHPLIYYGIDHRSKLSKNVLKIFNDCEEGKHIIYVPAAALIESSSLIKVGKVKTKNVSFERWCENLFKNPMFVFLPIEVEHVVLAHSYNFHNDIFDLLIVAAAKTLDLPLITKDSIITDANIVDVIW